MESNGQGTGLVEVQNSKLLVKFGERYSVEPDRVYKTLTTTAFREAKSADQVVALLIVADQYGLNPFTREIYAFPDPKSGGIVPVVGIDGWNRIAQGHPQFNGIELRYADSFVTQTGGHPCPEWVEAVVYRKDREHPIVVREYLDECYRPPFKSAAGNIVNGPWQTHTKRMLRHKAMIQGYRVAFGFHGIYDPDEAEGIVDITPIVVTPTGGRHGGDGEGMSLKVNQEPVTLPQSTGGKPDTPEVTVTSGDEPLPPETVVDDGTGL